MDWRKVAAVTCGAAQLALGVAIAAPARADDIVLAPSSPWNLNGTEKACSLRRMFGEPGNRAILQIERYGSLPRFQMVVAATALKSMEISDKLHILFGDSEPNPFRYGPGVMSATDVDGEVDPVPALILSNSLAKMDNRREDDEPVTPEMEAAVKTVTLRWDRQTLVLQTGAMDKPFAALRQCTDKLIESWGLDPAVQASLSKTAKPKVNPQYWVMPSEYPKDMVHQERDALIVFRLLIDASGKPSSCAILSSYGDEMFRQASCAAIMKRARFSPARDKTGTPVPTYDINSIRWSMH